MEPAFFVSPEVTAQRQEFYGRLDHKNTAPLWEALARLVTPEPRPVCVPAAWSYDELRPLLMEAGRLITAKEAERRVLVLENPGVRGLSQITQSLYAGLQLVMPGEVTSTHRHMASAIRLIVEGSGAYTAVNGERTTMHPGDFILTPAWTFHDHGNGSPDPVVWLDVLDVPIVNLFDTSFAEHYVDGTQPVTEAEGVSGLRFGNNMLPYGHENHAQTRGAASPVFTYPYAQTRTVLDGLRQKGAADGRHGIKMQFVNPASGGFAMPTIAAFVQLLPAGFKGLPYRSTDATIFCALEGEGRTQAGPAELHWKARDVFTVPSWCPVSHVVGPEAVLFSFSDRPAQQALGLWREQNIS
jgi:gentisate 1,2-dioxygenase